MHGRVKREKHFPKGERIILPSLWAKKVKFWERQARARIFFSDESDFHIFCSDGKECCWRQLIEELLDAKIKKNPIKHGDGCIVV